MPLGLNLHIYPSTLVNASRICKVSSSIQSQIPFSESHLVGITAEDLPRREEVAPGVAIVRVKGSRSRGTLGRILKVLLWQPRVYLRYRRDSVDVVASHNVWVLPMCYWLSRATGAKLVYNAHELETEAIAMSGVKQRIARTIEFRYIVRCQLVSVVNESIADWYERQYDMPRPVVVGNVPVVRDEPADLRARLGLGDDVMLYVHTGHLVHGRNIPLILDVFARHADKHVVFLGDGHLRGEVDAFARANHNIHLLPPVPPDMIVSNVREADVALCLIEQVALSHQLSSPNKLMEALAASIPALCSDLVEARRLLGPLAKGWILQEPAAELDDAIMRIAKADTLEFQEKWAGVRQWDDEVIPLVDAYMRVTQAINVVAATEG